MFSFNICSDQLNFAIFKLNLAFSSNRQIGWYHSESHKCTFPLDSRKKKKDTLSTNIKILGGNKIKNIKKSRSCCFSSGFNSKRQPHYKMKNMLTLGMYPTCWTLLTRLSRAVTLLWKKKKKKFTLPFLIYFRCL